MSFIDDMKKKAEEAKKKVTDAAKSTADKINNPTPPQAKKPDVQKVETKSTDSMQQQAKDKASEGMKKLGDAFGSLTGSKKPKK